MAFKRALALLACLLTPALASAAPAESQGAAVHPHLEHVAIWVADLEKTAAFLDDALGWRRHPLEFGVREDSEVFGGMKLAFVDANGFWLELVEPTTEGPGMEFLRQKGKGSIVELDFFVDDFDAAVKWLEGKGVQPWGMDGKPMVNGGLLKEWAKTDGKIRDADERILYLPMDVARGTSIELGWEYPSGVVFYRDETWTPERRTPASTPRMDHVTVASANLERTLEVYTETLELRRVEGAGLPRDWMGVTPAGQAWIHGNSHVWVNVVAPAGEAGKKVLADSRFGDGNIMEIAAEVADLDSFHDAMQAKGITLTAGDGLALPAGAKAVTGPSGDRFAYFPLDSSEGMRIMVFQRAKSGSVFAARDR